MASVHRKRLHVAGWTVLSAAAAITTLTSTAAPAVAQPISIPGLGIIEVPDGLPFLGDPPASSPPVSKTTGERAVEVARSKLGAQYSMGGTGPDSFDCSGLVQWSYRQEGIELPRTSYEQLGAGAPVASDDLQLGDLVFFYGGDHTGLYAGDETVIHASTYGRGVEISPISTMPLIGARRF
ncbi:C40 family peptidase [Nocardia australiensis]|uniref:C40 family peptidase n=1 Tax=Nocardia australiensis TaxID=2887191 RepID=UPI001D134A08|nr:C40 family peptidase [Nocardia australiensis]